MDNKLPHLPKHGVPVVPDAVEAQHFAVHLQELAQLVKVRRGFVGAESRGFGTAVTVGIGGAALGLVHLQTFTL